MSLKLYFTDEYERKAEWEAPILSASQIKKLDSYPNVEIQEVEGEEIGDLPEGWKCYLVTATGDEPLGYLFSILNELGIETEGAGRPTDMGYQKDIDGIGENSIYITHMATVKEKEATELKAAQKLCRAFVTENKIEEELKAQLEKLKEIKGIIWEEVQQIESTTPEDDPRCTVTTYALYGDQKQSETEFSVLFSISTTPDGDISFHSDLGISAVLTREDMVKEGKYRRVDETCHSRFFTTWSYDTTGLHTKAHDFSEVVTPASVKTYIEAGRHAAEKAINYYMTSGEMPKSLDESYTNYFNLIVK